MSCELSNPTLTQLAWQIAVHVDPGVVVPHVHALHHAGLTGQLVTDGQDLRARVVFKCFIAKSFRIEGSETIERTERLGR
jgi:hypothetical protein